MKTILAALGLAALVAGCDTTKTNVSTVGENYVLTKPDGCETVKDIRYECGDSWCQYQLFCEQDGGMVLYTRNKVLSEWTSFSVKE